VVAVDLRLAYALCPPKGVAAAVRTCALVVGRAGTRHLLVVRGKPGLSGHLYAPSFLPQAGVIGCGSRKGVDGDDALGLVGEGGRYILFILGGLIGSGAGSGRNWLLESSFLPNNAERA
jgi:hypothetical protein